MRDVVKLIKSRYSVRNFKPEPVPPELMEKLLEAARWAPSAGNLQPWFFYVLSGQRQREALAAAALNQRFITQAPLCIVVCAEPARSACVYGTRGRNLYCYQDTAAAAQNILLAATGLGLGTCWAGSFKEDEVRQVLSIPKNYIPVAIISVGYPAAGDSHRPGRREVSDMVKFVQ